MNFIKKVFSASLLVGVLGGALLSGSLLFNASKAFATNPDKIIVTNLEASSASDSIGYFGYFIDSSSDTTIEGYGGTILLSDLVSYTLDGMKSVIVSQMLTYASSQSYTGLDENDFVWHLPNLEYWHNGAKQIIGKHITFSGTTTSGEKVFYITDDGTANGNALCVNAPYSINVSVNDPANTFGLGYAVTNSNKTLTITVNETTVGTTTILGIPVINALNLVAASNGTPINVAVDCN